MEADGSHRWRAAQHGGDGAPVHGEVAVQAKLDREKTQEDARGQDEAT